MRLEISNNLIFLLSFFLLISCNKEKESAYICKSNNSKEGLPTVSYITYSKDGNLIFQTSDNRYTGLNLENNYRYLSFAINIKNSEYWFQVDKGNPMIYWMNTFNTDLNELNAWEEIGLCSNRKIDT
tara:strand:+ start:2445 stop:2825 length:381 start_codon:yes stop_codon:yes gene_type:complete